MFVNTATERSLELISSRAKDVYRAFDPGARPANDDVATKQSRSRAVLDALTVTAPDDDYFVTFDARGRTSYTRDGRMSIANGVLVGSNERPMLGYTSADGTPSELAIDPVDAELNRAQDLRIESDGSVVYDRRVIEPRSGAAQMQRVTIGRLALARFPAATRLTAGDDGCALAPAGVVPHLGRAADGNFKLLVPMQREESRIDLDRSLERLHDAYVAFDALQAANKAQGNTKKVAMDLLK